jgi:NAD+ diphosphatase
MSSNFVPVAALPDDPEGDDSWVFARAGQVLLMDDFETGPRPLTTEEAAQITNQVAQPLVLGRFDGETGHWWTGQVSDEFDPFDAPFPGLVFMDLRALMGTLDPAVWNVAGRATQVTDWYRDNQMCGRCGTQMEMDPNERSMRCPNDGLVVYPRLSPAVIVLVEHPDGRALLATNVAWRGPTPMYSTLAGFVEPGESLEDCIHREILEEVGVMVDDIRYFGSQPWPFPNSLMLGFFATYSAGEITAAPDEIADAQWFSRDDLPTIPPRASIARALIDAWLSR